jgi:hypothetical protein
MKNHPIADVWPMMDADKLQELADDIGKNGQLVSVWIYEGMILDGRNRYAACKMAGIEPKTQTYTGDEPTAFAVSMNDKRRHMNKGQLAAIGAELEPFFARDAKKRQRESGGDKVSEAARAVMEKIPEPLTETKEIQLKKKQEGVARFEAAKSLGVNDRYVQDAKKVKQEAPEVFDRLKAGKITLQDAKREVAKIPVDDWRKDERERQAKVNAGETVVANAQSDKNLICWAEREGYAIRIDRSTRYGNPFVMGEDGTRDAVCDAFEIHYLPHKPSISSRIKSGDLCGRVLICHCYPERCHGDCLASLANSQ